jgi:hypothetical protein
LPLPFGDQKRFLLRANTTFSKNVHETLEMAFDARAQAPSGIGLELGVARSPGT